MTGIIIAASIVGGVGILIGLFLGISGENLKVEVNEKEVAVRACLPGNNCGGCGYAGCDGLAAAIVKGEAKVNGCPVGGADVAAQIAEIMGVEIEETVRMAAFVKCSGTCDVAKEDYIYSGVEDCVMASMVPNGGSKGCSYGCLGFGTCAKVCEFGGISIVNGVAYIDREKCQACGQCVNACPKHLIEMRPLNGVANVVCSSLDKGKSVMDVCSVGCIGCTLCEKQCPEGAIEMVNNLPVIDYNKCTGCGACESKCPKKIIHIT